MTATTNEQQPTTGPQPDPQAANTTGPTHTPTEGPADAQDATEESTPDLDAIIADAATLNVEGIPVQVRRLKSREFFAMIKVLTRGMGPGIANIRLNTSDPEELQSSLMGIILFAVPNAIDEFGEFLGTIVEPRSSSDQKQLDEAMVNPEVATLIDVLGVMVEQEKDDLAMIAGKVQAWISKISPPTPT